MKLKAPMVAYHFDQLLYLCTALTKTINRSASLDDVHRMLENNQPRWLLADLADVKLPGEYGGTHALSADDKKAIIDILIPLGWRKVGPVKLEL